MRLQHSKYLTNLMPCILLLFVISQTTLSKHRPYSGLQSQNAITQTEDEAYKAWCDSQADFSRGISLATKYIELYPNGKHAAFLRRWLAIFLEFNRRDEERRQAAARNGLTILLEETTSSGKNRLLESLLNDLMEGPTDSNIRIAGGKTALMLAAANGNVESVRALINKGAEVNAREYTHGWTALVYSIWNQDIHIVEELLNSGADTKSRDKENRTPLEHARISGDADVIRLLERLKAR